MTTEETPTVRYTQATIDAALELLVDGVDTNPEIFRSVVEEHTMYRKMLGISEATFTHIDLMALYDEPEEDRSYTYFFEEYDGEDDGRYDTEDYESDDEDLRF